MMAAGSEVDFGEDPGPSGISFSPPVSEQRYQLAVNLTKKFKPKMVIDMGCGPCSVIRRLRWHHCIQELVGVDVDAELLRHNAHLGKPIHDDYLHPRENPFTVRLYRGSISMVDDRLLGCDLLICIEVIEHLYEEDLSKVPAVVFGALKPQRALFTTPNSDFNILFQNKTKRFRHPDHKFEWTRQEFKDWCSKICDVYPYSVEYTGVGTGPEGTEEYGYCSQAAVFTWSECSPADDEVNGGVEHQMYSQPYELISEITYPFKRKDSISLEKKVEWELVTCMRDALKSRPDDMMSHDDNDGRIYEMPLEMLFQYSSLRKICSDDLDILRNCILVSENLTMSEDGDYLLYREDDNSATDSTSDSDGDDDPPLAKEDEEDWDVG